ncbi:hypothetical protein DNTS_002494 [Danionella cerebrum]|uniref:SOCS box domain-containing protein n=1 Tax=Danionella cerebrum TaxID=2873325 RepID=A0A553PXK6_9TELE|nr:hypothetical protein DNTS_002494 [Danionella translucida]
MFSLLSGHTWESWEWDPDHKSPDARFTHGEHYWEIEFLEPPFGSSVMVGVGTQNALLHTGNQTFINLIDTELLLGLRSQRFSTLQEQCIQVITQSMSRGEHRNALPLPTALLSQIHSCAF